MVEGGPAWTRDPQTPPNKPRAYISEIEVDRPRVVLPFGGIPVHGPRPDVPRRTLPVAAWNRIRKFMPHTSQDWICLRADLRERRIGNWITFEFGDPADLPDVSACYAVLLDGHVVYVGQTKHLASRFRSHSFYLIADRDEPVPMRLTPWGMTTAERVQFKRRISRRHGDRLMYEARLIRRIDPQFNRSMI